MVMIKVKKKIVKIKRIIKTNNKSHRRPEHAYFRTDTTRVDETNKKKNNFFFACK